MAGRLKCDQTLRMVDTHLPKRRSPRLNPIIKMIHDDELVGITNDFLKPKHLVKRQCDDQRDCSVSSHASTRIKFRKLVEESTEKKHDIKKVWHGIQCPSCVDLSSIKKDMMACLQHHYKHCSCYSIFYRLMDFLGTQFKIPGGFIKESHFLNHNQAKQLCETASKKQKGKASSLLLKRAAELSDQLLGPVETAAFNCDHYEEYMKLLLDIAEKCLKSDDKTLIEDIKNYLKPFSRNQTSGEIIGYGKIVEDPQAELEKWSETLLELCHLSGDEIGTDDVKFLKNPEAEFKKWNETYLELSHSSGDKEFGKNLKDIVEPKRGRKCFFFPEKYDFPCHGQSAAGTSSNPINDGRDRVISLLRA